MPTIRSQLRSGLLEEWLSVCVGLENPQKKRSEKSIRVTLANELLEASEGKGGAVKKKDEVHKMAEANKAFSHFRF